MDADDLFETFEHEAFRLEAQPRYNVEPEITAFRAWQKDPSSLRSHPFPDWLEIVRSARRRSAKIRRLRMYEAPMSPYVQFEIESFRFNVVPDVGEEIYLLQTSSPPAQQDFWLFDNSIALLANYDSEFRFTGFDLVDVEEDVARLVELKRQLLTAAISVVSNH